MTPPPGEDTTPAQGGAPSSPAGASPSPPQPSPQMQQGAQSLIGVVNTLRGIAKAYPAASPHVQKINDELRNVMAIMMQASQPAEAQAGPNG